MGVVGSGNAVFLIGNLAGECVQFLPDKSQSLVLVLSLLTSGLMFPQVRGRPLYHLVPADVIPQGFPFRNGLS